MPKGENIKAKLYGYTKDSKNTKAVLHYSLNPYFDFKYQYNLALINFSIIIECNSNLVSLTRFLKNKE